MPTRGARATPPAEAAPDSVEALEARLSQPRAATVATLRALPGDIIILGAGGKMGPTLARLARRAATAADGSADRRRIIAVSRFGDGSAAAALRRHGVETVACDLLDGAAVAQLPDAPNVVYMVGQKFGTSGAPALTWAMNTLVAATCAQRYAASRIVAFSTGNVYPLVPASGGGARETDPPAPVGEYAASCLGRERMFEFISQRHGTPVVLLRLNYAVDLRYGVLVDLASRIVRDEPIDLRMGYVNVIWQGDANCVALEALAHASSPPYVVNVTGPERLSVRTVASALGERLGRTPRFERDEAADALLSDTARLATDFPYPTMSASQLIDWVAAWVGAGRPLLGKPTSFERRDGSF